MSEQRKFRFMLRRPPKLDDVFRALAHPTRLALLELLGRGPLSTSALAEPFGMALPSLLQHLALLERCGLVRSMKLGRIRMYRLQAPAFKLAETWLLGQRRKCGPR